MFQNFNSKRKKLRQKIRLQRTGRWAMRTVLVGGAIVATVLTLRSGASAFVLEPAFETAIQYQRQEEKKDKKDSEKNFHRQSAKGHKTKDIDSTWLWDNNVKEFEDLDRYNIED